VRQAVAERLAAEGRAAAEPGTFVLATRDGRLLLHVALQQPESPLAPADLELGAVTVALEVVLAFSNPGGPHVRHEVFANRNASRSSIVLLDPQGQPLTPVAMKIGGPGSIGYRRTDMPGGIPAHDATACLDENPVSFYSAQGIADGLVTRLCTARQEVDTVTFAFETPADVRRVIIRNCFGCPADGLAFEPGPSPFAK
jgi:hypothetical protein